MKKWLAFVSRDHPTVPPQSLTMSPMSNCSVRVNTSSAATPYADSMMSIAVADAWFASGCLRAELTGRNPTMSASVRHRTSAENLAST